MEVMLEFKKHLLFESTSTVFDIGTVLALYHG